MSNFERYKELESQLLSLREQNDYLLSEEDAILDEMDDIWWTLSSDEIKQLDGSYARIVEDEDHKLIDKIARKTMGIVSEDGKYKLVDQEVKIGESKPPRKWVPIEDK